MTRNRSWQCRSAIFYGYVRSESHKQRKPSERAGGDLDLLRAERVEIGLGEIGDLPRDFVDFRRICLDHGHFSVFILDDFKELFIGKSVR